MKKIKKKATVKLLGDLFIPVFFLMIAMFSYYINKGSDTESSSNFTILLFTIVAFTLSTSVFKQIINPSYVVEDVSKLLELTKKERTIWAIAFLLIGLIAIAGMLSYLQIIT